MRTLGKYGIKVKRNMEENYQSRFQELVNRGIIMDRLLDREKEILDKKHKIEKQLKEKYPKPVTSEFIVIARYNYMIEEITEELLKEEVEEKI